MLGSSARGSSVASKVPLKCGHASTQNFESPLLSLTVSELNDIGIINDIGVPEKGLREMIYKYIHTHTLTHAHTCIHTSLYSCVLVLHSSCVIVLYATSV